MTDEELERLRVEGDQPEPLFDPVRVCVADGCDNAIVRRAGETASNFKRRKCCSETCGKRVSSAAAAAMRRKDRGPAATKPCENPDCDSRLERRPKDTDERWAMRRFCSNRCRMLTDPPKRKQFAARQQQEADRKASPARVRIREGERWSPVFRDVTSIEPWRPSSWQKQEAS